MGIGSGTRDAVTAVINSLGSTVTLTEYTDGTTDGGYSGSGETTVSTQSELAIPYEEFSKLVKGKFGNLKTGGSQIALRYDANIDIDTKYKVTWQDELYDVTNIKRYTIQDILVAYIITVSRRLSQ